MDYKESIARFLINPLNVTSLFLYPLETSENIRFGENHPSLVKIRPFLSTLLSWSFYHHFYTPWKQKTYGFLMFSGGIEMEVKTSR